jgi:rod shape-determining protein MreC
MRDLFRFLQRARNILLFLVLMIVAMGMLVRGNEHHRAQAISSSNAVVGTLYRWQSGITSYARLGEVNRELAERNADLMNRHRSAYASTENRFVVINDTVQEQRYRYIAAQVIGGTHHKAKNYLTLDKGSKAGIREGMGVIGDHGIVGVVRESSERFASVISALNPDLSVSGQLLRSGHYGPITWDTRDPRTISLVEIAKHVPVTKGDTVVTRGGDGVFPRGVTVGTVTAMEDDPGSAYHRITVTLSEDLTRSAMVYVVTDLARIERDSLEARNPQDDR